jgi:hypothetical protein
MSPALMISVERWGRKNDSPTRSDAMRRLLELGLSVGKAPHRLGAKETARKAADLAAREVERVGDGSLAPEERARRKRALVQGPKEFREIREDQQKTRK